MKGSSSQRAELRETPPVDSGEKMQQGFQRSGAETPALGFAGGGAGTRATNLMFGMFLNCVTTSSNVGVTVAVVLISWAHTHTRHFDSLSTLFIVSSSKHVCGCVLSSVQVRG